MLDGWVEELKNQWAAGRFSDVSQFGTAILNAKGVGECEMADKVKNLDYQQIVGELDYGSSNE